VYGGDGAVRRHGTIRTVHTTYAAALKTTIRPNHRCRKPYAATEHLMLLMMGVRTRNMSSLEYVNKITYLHQVGISLYFKRNSGKHWHESSTGAPIAGETSGAETDRFYNTRCGAIGWGKALQAVRSLVRSQLVSLEVFIDMILQAALGPWG